MKLTTRVKIGERYEKTYQDFFTKKFKSVGDVSGLEVVDELARKLRAMGFSVICSSIQDLDTGDWIVEIDIIPKESGENGRTGIKENDEA